MATSAEIRNKAAKKLGLFGTGQTLRSAISADFDSAYTEVYAELAAKRLATWASSGEVPDELVHAVVSWVAGVRVDEYSVPSEKYQRVIRDFHGDGLYPSAENRIRALTAQDRVGSQKIESF